MFFNLVHSVCMEIEMKIDSQSLNILENLSDKAAHCIEGVVRIDDVILEEIDSTEVEDDFLDCYTYLHSKIQLVLDGLRCKYRLIQERIEQREMDAQLLLPSIPVRHSHNGRGRPCLVIDIDEVMLLRTMNFNWVTIAEMYGVSRSTLYRKCKEAGVHDFEKCQLVSYSELHPIVVKIKGDFPDIGERLLSGMLRAKNIRFSRETLRSIIHDTDPINTSLRWNVKISRRTYSVPGPNSLWHIGTYNYIKCSYIVMVRLLNHIVGYMKFNACRYYFVTFGFFRRW